MELDARLKRLSLVGGIMNWGSIATCFQSLQHLWRGSIGWLGVLRLSTNGVWLNGKKRSASLFHWINDGAHIKYSSYLIIRIDRKLIPSIKGNVQKTLRNYLFGQTKIIAWYRIYYGFSWPFDWNSACMRIIWMLLIAYSVLGMVLARHFPKQLSWNHHQISLSHLKQLNDWQQQYCPNGCIESIHMTAHHILITLNQEGGIDIPFCKKIDSKGRFRCFDVL